jgi:magnesium transporter
MADATAPPIGPAETEAARMDRLHAEVAQRGPTDAAEILEPEADATVVQVLGRLIPAAAVEILWEFPDDRRRRLLEAAPPERGSQWVRNQSYPEDTVGRLMDHPLAIFGPDLTAQQTTERLRELVRTAFITYAFVADPAGRLLGVLVFRELLFARPDARLRDIMLANPFSLRPDLPVMEAMREVLRRHYPVYPVCDADGRLVGVLRGQTLFEQQTLELSAQPGAMVGVEKEERLATPWWRSLRFRHPWLQLNLVTAFAAAGVVGVFQHTIDRLVILAVFLPVLAGQSGNTGCQALAVTLRGMTLGDLSPGRGRRILGKEALLGLLNGALVGLTAGIGMLVVAHFQDSPHAIWLAVVVFLAMVASCMVSGVSGVVVPMTLQRFGADPATASSIFLTTATDVTSMGLFLALATWLVR